MATGIAVRLGASVPDPDGAFPTFKIHRMLTAGTLVIFDAANGANPLTTVPAHGATIHNVARDGAASLTGQAAVSCDLSFANTFVAGEAEFTLTAKGALQGSVSQTVPNAHSAYIDTSAALKNFIFEHREDDWAFAYMHHLDRVAVDIATDLPISQIANSAASTANYLQIMNRNANFPSSGFSEYIGSRAQPGVNTVGYVLRTMGVNSWVGADPANAGAIHTHLAAWGAPGAYSGMGAANGASHTAQVIVLENLTISGRTYAEFDEAALAMFTADTDPTYGRYGNDTFAALVA